MEKTKSNTDTRSDLDRDLRGKDTNPDPITGAPGAHPGGTAAGTTAGGLAGAAAGAAIGSVVPGIGTVVGGVAGLVMGGVGGGLAGKAIAEHYDPTAEDTYWRENYKSRPYAARSSEYDYDRDYKPAYQFGWETSAKNPDASFDQAETELSKHWDKTRGSSRMKWNEARDATRDAWEHIRSSRGTTRQLNAGQEAAIPVVKEDIQVGKREVESRGGVRVETTVKERPVSEQINLREEHVKVERRPVDRPASSADFNQFQEGTIEVTERHEVPVVQKEARVVEEVRVGKEATNRTETVRDTVRETDVKVENLGTTGTRAFETYNTDFRTHFQQRYATLPDARYEVYEPAYRYGYNLAYDKKYSGRNDWNSLERDARSSWETHNPGTWEKFKDTIRHAWDKVRGRA